jgi:hypothetical protein
LAAAPSAHADLEDLFFQPIVDAVDHAAGLAGPGLDGAAVPAAASDVGGADSATIPLQMYNTTEPLVDLSVGGGPSIPVLVDSGSNGLVIPIEDLGLQNLSFPTGWGIGEYSGGLDYFYLTFNEPVNFGNGIVTAPTDVDAVLFTYPAILNELLSNPLQALQDLFTNPPSLMDIFTYPLSLQDFLAGNGADGILGIGPDAVGPGPSNVISALPGDLSDGVLINEPAGTLTFGPDPFSADAPSVNGVANTSLEISINGGPLQAVNGAIIDSGGVYGTIPSSVASSVPAGTEISVYNTNHELLYSYTTNATNGPVVTSGTTFNTGNIPFAQQPVYIGYTDGGAGATTTFGGAG